MDQPGTKAIQANSIHARKGTRPAGPGGMPYRPQQCTAKKRNGERCKGKPVEGGKVCSFHAD